jgi:hypothetical protein
MIALMLALQATAARTPMPVLPDIRFDLRDVEASSVPDPGADVVVTGRRRSYRLEPLAKLPTELMPRAGAGLFGGGMTLDVVPTILPNGIPSNRLMLTWKTRF